MLLKDNSRSKRCKQYSVDVKFLVCVFLGCYLVMLYVFLVLGVIWKVRLCFKYNKFQCMVRDFLVTIKRITVGKNLVKKELIIIQYLGQYWIMLGTLLGQCNNFQFL